MSMRRKVIQLTFFQRDENHVDGLVALCDDGTMWLGDANTWNASWVQIPDVPQVQLPERAP